jgi:hypothetical protein
MWKQARYIFKYQTLSEKHQSEIRSPNSHPEYTLVMTIKTILCVINIINKVIFNLPKEWFKTSWYKEYRDKTTVDWQGPCRTYKNWEEYVHSVFRVSENYSAWRRRHVIITTRHHNIWNHKLNILTGLETLYITDFKNYAKLHSVDVNPVI